MSIMRDPAHNPGETLNYKLIMSLVILSSVAEAVICLLMHNITIINQQLRVVYHIVYTKD